MSITNNIKLHHRHMLLYNMTLLPYKDTVDTTASVVGNPQHVNEVMVDICNSFIGMDKAITHTLGSDLQYVRT